MNEHDTRFWREIAIAYNQVAANHDREVIVQSSAEDLVAVVVYDKRTDVVMIGIQLKRESGSRKAVVTDATDRT